MTRWTGAVRRVAVVIGRRDHQRLEGLAEDLDVVEPLAAEPLGELAALALEEVHPACAIAAVEGEHGAADALELAAARRRAQDGEAVVERVAAVVHRLAVAERPDLDPLGLGAAAAAERDHVVEDADEQVDRDGRELPGAARAARERRLHRVRAGRPFPAEGLPLHVRRQQVGGRRDIADVPRVVETTDQGEWLVRGGGAHAPRLTQSARTASTAASVSASSARLSGRWRSTRAKRSATPPG